MPRHSPLSLYKYIVQLHQDGLVSFGPHQANLAEQKSPFLLALLWVLYLKASEVVVN